MANIVDYAKLNCDLTFKEQALSIEDALVLCELSYLKFDGLLEPMSKEPVSIKELASKDNSRNMFSDPKYGKDYEKLFNAALASKRFGDIAFSFYINKIEVENETQFAAVTYTLPTGDLFLAFRGTDESIVGWQEDFMLALDRPHAGRSLSVDYVNEVAANTVGRLYTGGHSKGGNHAVFSSMNADPSAKERIINVFSFDGPGFRPEVIKEYHGEDMVDRMVSVIPQSSLVGLLLDTGKDSIVVNSHAVGVMQHNPYYWVIKNGRFVRTEISEQHKLLISTFNEWLFSLDEAHLERFVKLFCEVLDATEASTTRELTGQIFKSAGNVIKKAKDIDEDTKEFLQGLIRSYFEIAKDLVKTEVKEKFDEASKAIKSSKKTEKKITIKGDKENE